MQMFSNSPRQVPARSRFPRRTFPAAQSFFSLAILCATELNVIAPYRDGVAVSWRNDKNVAESYVRLCRVESMPATYTQLAVWDFAPATNLTGKVVNIDETFSIDWPGLTGNVVRIATNTCGAIQVGTTKEKGFVSIDSLPEDAEHVIVRSRVRNMKNGRNMNICILGPNGETNGVPRIVQLTEGMQDYSIAIEALGKFVISPNAKKSPLQLASIRVVSDYVPPYGSGARL